MPYFGIFRLLFSFFCQYPEIKIFIICFLSPKVCIYAVKWNIRQFQFCSFFKAKSIVLSDLRLKFTTALMLIVLSISIAIMVLRFGMSVLKDNFVAELSTHYQNSAEFLSFYGLLNFYMYTMAFVYSPSKNAVFGTFF